MIKEEELAWEIKFIGIFFTIFQTAPETVLISKEMFSTGWSY